MPIGPHTPFPRKDKISVEYLVKTLGSAVKIELECCAAPDACANRFIYEPELHRPGLALAGYLKLYQFQRIQILGNTECEYLSNMGIEEQKDSFKKILSYELPVIFLTHGNTLPEYLLELAKQHFIPVFRTQVESTKFMFLLRDFLEDQFATQTVVPIFGPHKLS